MRKNSRFLELKLNTKLKECRFLSLENLRRVLASGERRGREGFGSRLVYP